MRFGSWLGGRNRHAQSRDMRLRIDPIPGAHRARPGLRSLALTMTLKRMTPLKELNRG